MSVRYDRSPEGKLTAWFHERADRVVFRKCGELIASAFGAEAFERFDAIEQVFWDFSIYQERVTLLLDARSGLGVLAANANARSDALVTRLAEHLYAELAR